MVVVGLEPTSWFMERSGFATSTRNTAKELWGDSIPTRSPEELVKELYAEENRDKKDPSGSQDMIGLVYPGVSRLDYDFEHEGGVFPVHIESNNDPEIASWLQSVIYILPIAQRPYGYDPLGERHFDPEWIQRLGQTGKDCYDAILARDIESLGVSINEYTVCCETVLPNTLRHPTLSDDLPGFLRYYQDNYAGALYSGCGGGYLYVISDIPVPGAFHPTIRVAHQDG